MNKQANQSFLEAAKAPGAQVYTRDGRNAQIVHDSPLIALVDGFPYKFKETDGSEFNAPSGFKSKLDLVITTSELEYLRAQNERLKTENEVLKKENSALKIQAGRDKLADELIKGTNGRVHPLFFADFRGHY